jgi:hypothetical protein
MMTQTIEVTDIDEDLLRYLDGRVLAREAKTRGDYLRGLLQRDLEQRLAELHAVDIAGKPLSKRTFSEIATPIADDIRLRGYMDDDVTQIIEDAVRKVRRERRIENAATKSTHQEAA